MSKRDKSRRSTKKEGEEARRLYAVRYYYSMHHMLYGIHGNFEPATALYRDGDLERSPSGKFVRRNDIDP